MEFSGQYLTYEEYKALGGTLDLTPFNLLEFEVRRKIDEKTFNRLKEVNDIPQEVKICEYKLIDSCSNYEKALNNKNIASENTDGYSVSYSSSLKEVIETKDTELNNIIDTYLVGVIVNNEHLLYCGA